MARRLLVFDAGLCSEGGHHFNFDAGITREAELHGLEWVVFGTMLPVSSTIVDRLRPRPLFRFSLYDSPLGEVDPVRRNLALNERYCESLDTLDPSTFRSDDILLFHTANSRNILGLAHWLEHIAKVVQPLVVIYVNYADYIDERTGNNSWRLEVFRQFFARLNRNSGLQVRVLVETQSIQEDLQELAGSELQIGLGPFVSDYSQVLKPQSQRRGANADCRLRLGYFGSSRFRKGVQMVPELVSNVCVARSQVDFTAHIYIDGIEPSELQHLTWPLRDMPRVTLLEGALSNVEYFEHVRSCDILILPYSIGYNRQNSAILSEALAMGKILVVPDYCGFQAVLEPYHAACTYFSHWDVRSIAFATIEAIDTYAQLAPKAQAAIAKFIDERGPRVFFDRIFVR